MVLSGDITDRMGETVTVIKVLTSDGIVGYTAIADRDPGEKLFMVSPPEDGNFEMQKKNGLTKLGQCEIVGKSKREWCNWLATGDLKFPAERHAGSSPASRTIS